MTDKKPNSNVKEEETESIQWSAQFPATLADKMRGIVNRWGYKSMAEFIREACRDKAMYMETYDVKQILDTLTADGKITAKDIKEAIFLGGNEGRRGKTRQ